jgi:hypothetical protein
MTPTPVQCIDCTRFSLRGHKGMASQGYGQCALVTPGAHFESATFLRHCASFERAGIDVSEARRAWLDGRREQFNQSIDEVTP